MSFFTALHQHVQQDLTTATPREQATGIQACRGVHLRPLKAHGRSNQRRSTDHGADPAVPATPPDKGERSHHTRHAERAASPRHHIAAQPPSGRFPSRSEGKQA